MAFKTNAGHDNTSDALTTNLICNTFFNKCIAIFQKQIIMKIISLWVLQNFEANLKKLMEWFWPIPARVGLADSHWISKHVNYVFLYHWGMFINMRQYCGHWKNWEKQFFGTKWSWYKMINLSLRELKFSGNIFQLYWKAYIGKSLTSTFVTEKL